MAANSWRGSAPYNSRELLCHAIVSYPQKFFYSFPRGVDDKIYAKFMKINVHTKFIVHLDRMYEIVYDNKKRRIYSRRREGEE